MGSRMNWSKAHNDRKGYKVASDLKLLNAKEFRKKKKKKKNTPIPLDPLTLVWRCDLKKKAHVRTLWGTMCKLENQGSRVMAELNRQGPQLPAGVELCELCREKTRL